MSGPERGESLRIQGPLDETSQISATRVWVEEDQFSVIRMVPPKFAERLLALPDELKVCEEGTIRSVMRKVGCKLTPLDTQLRLAFWLEYERCVQRQEKKINLCNVYAGICVEEYFYQHYLSNQYRLAFMLCPPQSYSVKMQEMMELGLARLREIMTMDMIDEKTGKVDTRIAKLVMQAAVLVDLRVKGAVAQRIETVNKSAVLHVDLMKNREDLDNRLQQNSMELLDAKLKQMEETERRYLAKLQKEADWEAYVRDDPRDPKDVIDVEGIMSGEVKPTEALPSPARYELCTVGPDGVESSEIIDTTGVKVGE